MNTESITQVVLMPGEALVSTRVPKDKKPSFRMIGSGKMNKHNIDSIDLLDVMAETTTAGRFVIITIKNAVEWDNPYGEVRIWMQDLTKSQQRIFKKGFKELKEIGIIKRPRRTFYMLNPKALIPRNFEKAEEYWNSLS